MSKEQSNQVEITNVGPIGNIVLDFPTGRGGVMLLVAHNAAGKTTAIAAVNGLLATGKIEDLTVREGAESGEIEGFGRKVKLGKRQVRTGGESIVSHLCNRLDVEGLVSPKYQEDKARKKARIRALVSLCVSDVTAEKLLGDKFEMAKRHVDLSEARKQSDPVDMADFIKRAIDRAANDIENDTKVKAQLASAKRVEAGDVDELKEEPDAQKYSAEHRSLMAAQQELERQRQASLQASEREADRARRLEESLKAYTGRPSVEIQPEIEKLDEQANEIAAAIRKLQDELANVSSERKHKVAELGVARQAERAIEAIKAEQIQPVDNPTDEAIAKATAATEAAYSKLVGCQDISKRRAALEEAQKLQALSVDLDTKAKELRELAGKVTERVQECLPKGPISIDANGDLVAMCNVRNKLVPYDKMSEGQRWRIAMEYAVRTVGEGGIIPLTQESWQSLDSTHRSLIAELAAEHKVWILSADISDEPLHVEEFKAEPVEKKQGSDSLAS